MITEQDKTFLSFIKQHKHIGYGRMIQIISNAWYEELERGGEMTGQAALVGKCLAFQPEPEKRAFLQVLESEKAQGMDY